MALLKRLGTSLPPQTEEEGGLGRRLSQPPAEQTDQAGTHGPVAPVRPVPTPAGPHKEGGLLDRIGGPATPAAPGETPRPTPPPSKPAGEAGRPAPPPTDGSLLGRISTAPQETPEEESYFGRKVRRAPPDPMVQFKFRVQDRVISEIGPRLNKTTQAEIHTTVERCLADALAAETILLGQVDRLRLIRDIEAEVYGYGPLQVLLDDATVNEVMANGPDRVYVERRGKVELSPVRFYDEEHMLRVIDRILTPLGRRVDESSPMADARLPDGSRVNIVIPPLSLVGPTITIRKFSKKKFTTEDFIDLDSISPDAAVFLAGCIWARLNVIVSGGASSGKTTLLNILSSYIPSDERIVTVETTAELALWQEHVVPLEARPPNIEGKGEVDIRQLVINCLRMRPERIVVGECRGGEAIDMLQAMNTGHDGSLTTTHANSPADVISRMEVMCMMAGMNLPSKAIREQIASAVQLIVHMTRMRDGTRKVVQVTEIQGMEGTQIILQDIFVFEQQGMRDGHVVGQLRPTGFVPRCLDTLAAMNVQLPTTIFEPGQGLRLADTPAFTQYMARFGRHEEAKRVYHVDWLT